MIKQIILGFIVGMVLSVTTLTVYAKEIEVIFGQVKLVVDGNPVDKETMLYNGTTYVPLRATAEILGKEVVWTAETSTANIID